MERFNLYPDKFKKGVAISLASTALLSCGGEASENYRLTVVPVASTDTFRQSLVIVPHIDLTEKLEEDWDKALENHVGEVDIAVYDFASGETAHTHYPKQEDGMTFDTASIVKLSILENLLLQSQIKNQPVGDYQKSLAARMIENSDNNATAVLWNQVGDAPEMDEYWQRQLGTTSTVGGTGGYWGNTQTTALDQLKVVNAIAYTGTRESPLSAESGVFANELMKNVEPDQRWGVSGGVPANVTVNLKNGWMPDSYTTNKYSDTTGWTINSIGYIPGEYSIAILTRGNATMQDGITTTENLSAVTWNNMRDSADG